MANPEKDGDSKEVLEKDAPVQPTPEMLEDRPAAQGEDVAEASEEAGFDAIDATLRLAVGGACNLADLVVNQLRVAETSAAKSESISTTPADESVSTLIRHALVGQLFVAQHRLRKELASAADTAMSMAGGAAQSARPLVNSRLAAPARTRVVALSERIADEIADRVQIGRQQEAIGRLTSRDVADHVMDDIFGYMAENPEVAELVRQQGRGMVAENLDVVRLRTANRDSSLETVVRNLLHRSPRSQLNGAPDVVKRQAVNSDESEPT